MPKGKPVPEPMARANAAKSALRVGVAHVFAHQKNRSGLFVRTIGLARAQAKLTLANLACNFDRLMFHQRRAAAGWVRLKSKERPEKPRNIAEKRPIGPSSRVTRGNNPTTQILGKFFRHPRLR